MSGAKGHTNHVTTPDLNTKNGLVTWVDVKHATPLQDEAHLVFRMRMFLVEFIKHGVKVWCVWVNIYTSAVTNPPCFLRTSISGL